MEKSTKDKRDNPVYRYLRGYALDPGFSTRLDTFSYNEVIYRVPFEDLEAGPAGEYLEVVDFDPASKSWYEPVDLRDERIASQQGLAPSEGNPQFHQQLVYAVVMKTIRHFEQALGRKILWCSKAGFNGGQWQEEYVQKLRLYPHAFRGANAYYDPEKKALLFGYFPAAYQNQGTNYPGGLVFTCLSPDIVAHEATHAILDSIHDRYLEETNRDVAAFHEGFADIVALLQRFTFASVVKHQLADAHGRLENYSVLGELATQFGEALEGNHGALRSMIGQWVDGHWVHREPNPTDYQTTTEPHDRGAVLVATIFDVFQRVYNFRTRDLLRIASNGTGVLPKGSISHDLVGRLAEEASIIAEHLLHICIRALDYCPPSDITFGNYLRALITADLDIAPEDENRYRLAAIEAFRARGIFPDRVNSLSMESLRWERPEFTKEEEKPLQWISDSIKSTVRELVETGDRAKLFDASNKAKAALHRLFMSEQQELTPDEWEAFLDKLGLTSRPISQLFGADTASVKFLNEKGRKADGNEVPKIEVHTLRPAFRLGREGRQVEQVVISLTQKVKVDIGSDGEVKPMVFRGGCTLILSLGHLNEVEYVISKRIRSYSRLCRQREYLEGDDGETAASTSSLYSDGSREVEIDFNLLHNH